MSNVKYDFAKGRGKGGHWSWTCFCFLLPNLIFSTMIAPSAQQCGGADPPPPPPPPYALCNYVATRISRAKNMFRGRWCVDAPENTPTEGDNSPPLPPIYPATVSKTIAAGPWAAMCWNRIYFDSINSRMSSMVGQDKRARKCF